MLTPLMNHRHLLAIPVLLATLGVHAQDRTADPLAPLAQCINRSQFQFRTQDRLPAGATTRIVKMAAGDRQISTADGYRLMLFRKSSLPFVNLKIERSAEGQFAADRETIVAQMREMAARGKLPQQLPLETDSRDGWSARSDRQYRASAGIISLYTLLHAASGTSPPLHTEPPADSARLCDDAQYQRARTIDCLACSCMADRAVRQAGRERKCPMKNSTGTAPIMAPKTPARRQPIDAKIVLSDGLARQNPGRRASADPPSGPEVVEEVKWRA